MGRYSHKTKTAKYTEHEYLAVAKALLGGDFDTVNLARPLRELQAYAFQPISLPEDPKESDSVFLMLRSLSVWYAIRDDLEHGRFPADSSPVKAADIFANHIVSICAPQMVSFLIAGQHEAFRKLAAIIEAAKTVPPLGDQRSQDKKLQSVRKALGLTTRKPHKATDRIRLLLPLWRLGFGDLSPTKRYEILEKAGLEAKEIPDDDAMRQRLTYYKIPALRKLLGPKNTSR